MGYLLAEEEESLFVQPQWNLSWLALGMDIRACADSSMSPCQAGCSGLSFDPALLGHVYITPVLDQSAPGFPCDSTSLHTQTSWNCDCPNGFFRILMFNQYIRIKRLQVAVKAQLTLDGMIFLMNFFLTSFPNFWPLRMKREIW